MTEDRPFDEAPLEPDLRDAARAYNAPPPNVPREAMWTAIEARRRSGGRTSARGLRADRGWGIRPWLLAAAACAVMATGMTIGWIAHMRVAPNRQATSEPTLAVSRGDGRAYQITMTRNLAQAEALFTTLRDARGAVTDSHDAQLARWANDLLGNTRLLLDSPAAADPRRRRLLEDLELVLVQIVELGPNQSATDRQMIDQTLDHNHMLTRLRAAVPAGTTGI